MSASDRGAPWSDLTIRIEMERLHERIEAELSTLKVLGERKARATNERQVHEATEILKAKANHRNTLTSDKLREAHVRANTPVGDLMLAEDLATTLYWDQKELVVTLRQDMSMLQSMLRNAEDQVAAMGGGPNRSGQSSPRQPAHR